MGYYGAGASKAGVNTANTAYFQIRPTGTTARLRIYQIVINISVAPTTAPSFYLARSTAIGTVTTTLAGQPLEPADPTPIGTFDSAFSVAPTFSTTNFISTGGLATTAGGAWVWTFPSDGPLVVTNSTAAGIVVVNQNLSGATVGTFVGSVLWDE
jgi:hypothetical protein